MINPIEYDDGVALLASINRCSNEEARDAIDYLLTEKILINFDEFEKISKDEFYGRELSYFYMLSNKNKRAKFENVRHKKIAILGVGGIGSVVAEMIVRAGFDNLLLVDNDVVESSNLIRQIGYLREDVNKSKLDSLFRHLLQINPKTDINKPTINANVIALPINFSASSVLTLPSTINLNHPFSYCTIFFAEFQIKNRRNKKE